jgi:hypothetical protein
LSSTTPKYSNEKHRMNCRNESGIPNKLSFILIIYIIDIVKNYVTILLPFCFSLIVLIYSCIYNFPQFCTTCIKCIWKIDNLNILISKTFLIT